MYLRVLLDQNPWLDGLVARTGGDEPGYPSDLTVFIIGLLCDCV